MPEQPQHRGRWLDGAICTEEDAFRRPAEREVARAIDDEHRVAERGQLFREEAGKAQSLLARTARHQDVARLRREPDGLAAIVDTDDEQSSLRSEPGRVV